MQLDKARKGWEEYENMERKLKKKMAEVEKNKKRKRMRIRKQMKIQKVQ